MSNIEPDNGAIYTDENGRKYKFTLFKCMKNGKTYTCKKKYYIKQEHVGRPKKTQKEKIETELNRIKLRADALNAQLTSLVQ